MNTSVRPSAENLHPPHVLRVLIAAPRFSPVTHARLAGAQPQIQTTEASCVRRLVDSSSAHLLVRLTHAGFSPSRVGSDTVSMVMDCAQLIAMGRKQQGSRPHHTC
jgi:hypothetical protein